MSEAYGELIHQLRVEVGAVAATLAGLVGPDEATEMLEARIHARAPMWAAELLQDEDDHLAAGTTVDLMAVLWRHSDPPTDWWATPLGQAIARSAGIDDKVVSYSVAGAILGGVTKQYIGKLVNGGRLQRGPDGGVTLASLRSYLSSAGR